MPSEITAAYIYATTKIPRSNNFVLNRITRFRLPTTHTAIKITISIAFGSVAAAITKTIVTAAAVPTRVTTQTTNAIPCTGIAAIIKMLTCQVQSFGNFIVDILANTVLSVLQTLYVNRSAKAA